MGLFDALKQVFRRQPGTQPDVSMAPSVPPASADYPPPPPEVEVAETLASKESPDAEVLVVPDEPSLVKGDQLLLVLKKTGKRRGAARVPELLAEGYLREGTTAEKLDSLTIDKLKPLLKQFNLPVSGKKSDLVERLLSGTNAEALATSVASVRTLAPTARGDQAIAAYRNARERVDGATFDLVLAGHVEQAGSLVARFFTRHTDQTDSRVDWNKGMDRLTIDLASHLNDFSYDDVPYDPPTRRRIAAALACSALWGEAVVDGAKRMLKVTGGTFTCPILAETLQGNENNLNQADGLASAYASHRWFAGYNYACLRSYLSAQDDGTALGVYIATNSAEPCELCAGEQVHRSWQDIESLPTLPRHWGCTCLYQLWHG